MSKACLLALALVVDASGQSRATMASEPSTPAPATVADLYVAPGGKDSNRGSADEPLATLAKARDVVREKVAAGLTQNVRVLIRGGIYEQATTLDFGPPDSGSEKHSITYAGYPGEQVVLSGGRKISGWKKGEGEIWTTDLPDVKAGKWHFRQENVVYRTEQPLFFCQCSEQGNVWRENAFVPGQATPPQEALERLQAKAGPRRSVRAPDESEQKAEWLAQNLLSASAGDPLPFSFACDGKPSGQLLPRWQRTSQATKLDDQRTQHSLT